MLFSMSKASSWIVWLMSWVACPMRRPRCVEETFDEGSSFDVMPLDPADLMPLVPEELGWIEGPKATVDSGAADNVMPRRLLRGRRVRPSEASRAGVNYVACNNGKIPNEGESDLSFTSQEGHTHSWTFQIAEVNNVLASVSWLVDHGHRVVFDQDSAGRDVIFITNNESQKTIKMKRDRNVLTIDAYVVEDQEPGLPGRKKLDELRFCKSEHP